MSCSFGVVYFTSFVSAKGLSTRGGGAPLCRFVLASDPSKKAELRLLSVSVGVSVWSLKGLWMIAGESSITVGA